MEINKTLQQLYEACEALTEDEDTLTRELTSRIADKWSMWVLSVLGNAGPMRFSRVLEQVEGISQKSLTKTLRQLERDGFVTRTVYVQVPLRVDYELTSVGGELLLRVAPLWHWVAENIATFQQARERFDAAKS